MKTRIPYIIIVVSFLFTLCGCQNTQNQAQPATEIGPSIITPENIDQLEYIERWGKQGLYQVAISDDHRYSAGVTGIDIILYDMVEEEKLLDIDFDETSKPNDITPLAFSHDNHFFAYGQKDVTIWNVGTETDETVIHLSEGASYPCYLMFDDSNRYLVIVGYGSPDNDRILEANLSIYDLENKEIILEAPFQYRINNDMPVPISPTFINDDRLAFFDRENQLIFWDLVSHEMVFSKTLEQPLLSISTDGLKYSTIDEENGKTSFHNLQSDEEEHSISGWGYYLPGQEDAWLAVTPYKSADDWKVLAMNEQERCDVEDLYITYKETILQGTNAFFIFNDQTVQAWDLITCEEIFRSTSPKHGYVLDVSPDGSYLASLNGSNINIIRSSDGTLVNSFSIFLSHLGNERYKFSSDGQTIVFVHPGYKPSIYVYDFVNRKILQTIPLGNNEAFQIEISPDSKYAAVFQGGMQLWNLETETKYGESLSGVNKLWFSPDSSMIATVETDKLLIRDIENMEILKELELPDEYDSIGLMSGTYIIQFNHQLTEYFTFSTQRIERWDMDGNRLAILPMSVENEEDQKILFWCADISADGRILAAYRSGFSDGKVFFWDTHSGEIIKELEIDSLASDITFDPISARFFIEHGGYIHVWGVKEE